VLNPEDDPVMWIKFANLCRKSDRMQLAEKTINSLMSPDRVGSRLYALDLFLTSFTVSIHSFTARKR
jgi:phosphatidylinositol kinase/protein kinase (PI-3  family)